MSDFDSVKLATAFTCVIATVNDANPDTDEHNTFELLGKILEEKGFEKDALVVWKNADGTPTTLTNMSVNTINYDDVIDVVNGYSLAEANEIHQILASVLTHESLDPDMVNGVQLTLAQVFA